jgi:hypothetical protein
MNRHDFSKDDSRTRGLAGLSQPTFSDQGKAPVAGLTVGQAEVLINAAPFTIPTDDRADLEALNIGTACDLGSCFRPRPDAEPLDSTEC